jgi:hypothetical protein
MLLITFSDGGFDIEASLGGNLFVCAPRLAPFCLVAIEQGAQAKRVRQGQRVFDALAVERLSFRKRRACVIRLIQLLSQITDVTQAMGARRSIIAACIERLPVCSQRGCCLTLLAQRACAADQIRRRIHLDKSNTRRDQFQLGSLARLGAVGAPTALDYADVNGLEPGDCSPACFERPGF